MTKKLKSQLGYLLVRIILMLFEELHEITGFVVYFSNLYRLLFRLLITNKG